MYTLPELINEVNNLHNEYLGEIHVWCVTFDKNDTLYKGFIAEGTTASWLLRSVDSSLMRISDNMVFIPYGLFQIIRRDHGVRVTFACLQCEEIFNEYSKYIG